MAEFTGHVRILRADNEFLGAADILPDNAADVGSDRADIPFKIVRADHQDKRKVGSATKNNVLSLKLEQANGTPCRKEWILNKTNATLIAAMYGAKAGNWKGKWIWLYVDPAVRNPGGGTIAGIRVRAGKTQAPPTQQSKGATT